MTSSVLRRRQPDGGRTPLTAHERRIALLAAGGHTNQEISERFEVTTRAVEYHLTKVYQKLGIRSRDQLRRDLVAPGPA